MMAKSWRVPGRGSAAAVCCSVADCLAMPSRHRRRQPRLMLPPIRIGIRLRPQPRGILHRPRHRRPGTTSQPNTAAHPDACLSFSLGQRENRFKGKTPFGRQQERSAFLCVIREEASNRINGSQRRLDKVSKRVCFEVEASLSNANFFHTSSSDCLSRNNPAKNKQDDEMKREHIQNDKRGKKTQNPLL